MSKPTLTLAASEFPDYPAADLPTIPAGFVDQSWHNDTCPSFYNEALRLQLFVDYLDPAQRELGADAPRFSLNSTDDEGCAIETVLATDDWNQITMHVALLGRRNAKKDR